MFRKFMKEIQDHVIFNSSLFILTIKVGNLKKKKKNKSSNLPNLP